MFSIRVEYPSEEEEFEIMKAYTGNEAGEPDAVLTAEQIIDGQKAVRSMPVADHVMRYAEKLVRVTRPESDEALDLCKQWLSWGAGPRAGLNLILAAKAHALLRGQNYVSCENVAAVTPPVFRHRIIPNFAAQSKASVPTTSSRRSSPRFPRRRSWTKRGGASRPPSGRPTPKDLRQSAKTCG